MILLLVTALILSATATVFDQSQISKSTHLPPGTAASSHIKSRSPQLPFAQPVNPYNLYRNEPAPMGISDYGIGPGGSPYSYSTTSFLGSINIKNLYTYNASLNSSATELTFQLNINFVFYVGSTEYVYWVQNVADFNTSSTPSIGFIDNVWNETGTGSSVYNSTLSGNGTVGNSSGTLFYYAFANQSLPGNDIYVSYPTNVLMAINSTTTAGGIPELLFLYNDGHGWQTYDNVLFDFAANVTKNDGFVVDGYAYEPDGYSFYDAELILGGPGDGTQTSDIGSNVSLQLEYYNGHNYQMVTNAYNFGSDTAEGISNVTSTAKYYNSNGSLFASVQNGSGQLTQIYNRDQIGILNITAGVNSGYTTVNGTRIDFTGGGANFTLAPGTYLIRVYGSNGTLVFQRNETIPAGGYRTLSPSTYYNVTFVSSGLPSSAVWYLNLSNGESFHSSSTNISIELTNGSYAYNATSGDSYYSHGSFSVSGAKTTIDVVFKAIPLKQYEIVFQETGLTVGNSWTVTLTGTQKSSSSSSIVFNVTNGTYSFTVGTVGGFTSTPSSGDANVSGSNVTVNVVFTPVVTVSKYSVVFVETGLINGVWYVNLTDGQSAYSSSTTIYFLLPNGAYNYSVSTGNQLFGPNPANGTFTVSGSSVRVSIAFTELPLDLVFNETGLPSGTLWSVTVNGTTESSTSSSITFIATPGTYVYLIRPPSGYAASTLSGTVRVVNSSTSIQVAFSQVEYNLTFLVSGLPAGTLWTITLNGSTLTTSLSSVTFSVTDGNYAFSIGGITGYTVQPSNGTIKVNGASVTETIAFSKEVTDGYFTGSVSPANVTIYVNGQSYSESNGQFNISLSPGSYQVKIEAPGYSTYITNITVSSSAVTLLQVHSITKSTTPTSLPFADELIFAIVAILVVSFAAIILRRRRV